MLCISHSWSRKMAANPYSYSFYIARLPLEWSALSHCSLSAGWSGRPRPFLSIYVFGQTGRVRTSPRNLKTHHPQCSISNNSLRENRHLLDYYLRRERILPISMVCSFCWYLRHLELLRILVLKKNGRVKLSLVLILIFCLFLPGTHNLLSTSSLWLNQYRWNDQLFYTFIRKPFKGW